MRSEFRGFEAATVACRSELSNISHDLLQLYFANPPFEKGIFVYPQNLWITLWMTLGDGRLTRRNVRVFLALPIFCVSTKPIINSVLL